MHPLARVFQIILLAAGVLLGGVGYVIYYDDFQQTTTIDFDWDCSVNNDTEECRSVVGRLDAGSRDEGLMNIAFGGILVLAGGVVAVGGRRRTDKPAQPAPQPVFQGPPPPPQGGPVPPPQGGPVPPQRF